MKLGQILVRKKKISLEQLEREVIILEEQRAILEEQIKRSENQYKRLGERLVEKGIIEPHDLSDALQEQFYRQNGFWVID